MGITESLSHTRARCASWALSLVALALFGCPPPRTNADAGDAIDVSDTGAVRDVQNVRDVRDTGDARDATVPDDVMDSGVELPDIALPDVQLDCGFPFLPDALLSRQPSMATGASTPIRQPGRRRCRPSLPRRRCRPSLPRRGCRRMGVDAPYGDRVLSRSNVAR